MRRFVASQRQGWLSQRSQNAHTALNPKVGFRKGNLGTVAPGSRSARILPRSSPRLRGRCRSWRSCRKTSLRSLSRRPSRASGRRTTPAWLRQGRSLAAYPPAPLRLVDANPFRRRYLTNSQSENMNKILLTVIAVFAISAFGTSAPSNVSSQRVCCTCCTCCQTQSCCDDKDKAGPCCSCCGPACCGKN